MSSFFHNSLVFPDHCLVGFGHPTTALKPSGALAAAMLFNGARAFPSPQLPPIYGYMSPTGSSMAAAPGYPAGGSAQKLIDRIPRSSRPSPVDLSSVQGMPCGEIASSGAYSGAAAVADMTSPASIISMALPIWRSDYRTDRQMEQASAFGMGISQHDLDMALYGYSNSAQQQNFNSTGYALSGLKSSDLSYGIDRLLGKCESSPSRQHHQTAEERVEVKTFNLPEGLGLYKTEIAGLPHYGVVCLAPVIPRSTRFGPFRGRLVDPTEVKGRGDNSFLWEIFRQGVLSHFIDGSDCYWMTYVNCARTSSEQNLVVLQQDGSIYYEACKDIRQGTELLVWYGDAYLKFMDIPIAMKPSSVGGEHDEFNNQEDANDGYTCQRCGKVFAYKYYRDKHLKYTRCVDQGDRKFPCDICSRSFEKRDRLRIHILHVHEKHRPHKCSLCNKCFSQSSSLNKHMRVHSGERPYKCPHCIKAFTASSILRTHIRQHSGEKPFKCKHCGKAFASHAAHDSHVKRTHNNDNTCALCGRFFPDACLLRLHTCTRSNGGVTDRPIQRRDVVGLASFQPPPPVRMGAFSPAASSPRPSHPPSHTPAASSSSSASKRSRDDLVKVEDEIDVVGYDYLNEKA